MPPRLGLVEGFGFSTDVAVRFAETDAQGVVHHAAYLVWFEVARVEYLARFDGGYPGFQREGYEALTIDAHVRYRKAARFGETVRIHTRCVGVGPARFRFEYAVARDGELVADGSTGHACVDATTLRPTRLPSWLTEAIARAEAGPGPPGSAAA
jgi:acyl-CoA thioester hydrolase